MTGTKSFYDKSPLDTLVRQSSRRTEESSRPQLSPSSPQGLGNYDRHPTSPLLHGRFRASVSTALSTDSSFMDPFRASVTAGQSTWSHDDESVYSSELDPPEHSSADNTPNFAYVVEAVGNQLPTFVLSPTPSLSTMPDEDRRSWESHGSRGTIRSNVKERSANNLEGAGNGLFVGAARDTWRSSSGVDPFTFQKHESPQVQVPKVVISSPSSSTLDSTYHGLPSLQATNVPDSTTARPSATQYSVLNFSRPIRPPTTQDENRKIDVSAYNQSTRLMQTPASPPSQRQNVDHLSQDRNAHLFSQNHFQNSSDSSPLSHTSHQPQCAPDPGWVDVIPAMVRSTSPNGMSDFRNTVPDPHSSPPEGFSHIVCPNPTPNSFPGHIRLPNSPPSPRPDSRVSLYSTYSFYQLDDGSRTPSPSFSRITAPVVSDRNLGRSLDAIAASKSCKPSPVTHSSSTDPHTTPDDYLYLGIQHHEADRLEESAHCFERAATVDGGCGVGMLMWGLSLRHAWGTTKDEKSGFLWLRRAAEAAVSDLEAAAGGKEQKAIRTELVLAIYEVAQCFFHGWGVQQDKKMGVSYFRVAARLGDIDAQQDLGFCLANGKGCKKNLKEAAKWYRAAAAQGASTVGLAWIYKPKYS